jgi:hypothetical protein
MSKQGLLSIVLELMLVFFLFTGLPLPARVISSATLNTVQNIEGGAARKIEDGDQSRAMLTSNAPGKWAGSDSSPSGDEESYPQYTGLDGITRKYYPVYGCTLNELGTAACIPDEKPAPGKKGEGYAAYAQAEFEVKYQPVFRGIKWQEGQVAIELGARGEVHPHIVMFLPAFHPSEAGLESACRAEEARIEKHEMAHVAVFRSTSEKLQAAIGDISVTGFGSNILKAWKAAEDELRKTVDENLNEAVSGAESMNEVIDFLTDHGTGTCEVPSRVETTGVR